VNVFFDNNLPIVLADVLDALIRVDGHRALHIAFMEDMGLARNASDLEWINFLGRSGSRDWIVMTSDRLERNKPQRVAFKREGLRGFVFESAFQKKSMKTNEWAATLLLRWPEMLTFIQLASAGSLHAIPVRRSAGFRALLA
jgi:hypothetical protein